MPRLRGEPWLGGNQPVPRTPAGRDNRPMEIYKPLVALLALVNPIGVIPFFIHFTQGFSAEQRRRTSVSRRSAPSR